MVCTAAFVIGMDVQMECYTDWMSAISGEIV